MLTSRSGSAVGLATLDCLVAEAGSCAVLCICRLTLVALGSLVSGAALRPNTPLLSVVICAVVVIGFTVAVNNAYARGWIPGRLLRPQPILLWVDGEPQVAQAQRIPCYDSTSSS